ncbi:MAG TPA: hypothetical protein VLY04_20410 [Bryobacteraceae bacterium]|nr:hypothetical protein [Bryobacteraceae bacterium]
MHRFATAALLLAGWQCGTAAELRPPTVEAFDRYIRQTEQRLDARKTFLWADESPARAQRVRQGEVVVEPTGAKALIDVPNGLIHDWVGAVFIPRVTVLQTIEHVQDYDHSRTEHREVMASHILAHSGNEFRVYMRLLKKKVITVVLDTEHDVRYFPIDQTHWRSQSRTTRITEVENAGKPHEYELPPGAGAGFLWKLYTYWRFEQRDGGTWMECQAISLTRDIPTGLGWLLEPIIRSLPRESLENTLRETAAALEK